MKLKNVLVFPHACWNTMDDNRGNKLYVASNVIFFGQLWNFTSSDFKFLKIELGSSNPFQLQYCKQPTQSGKSGKISHFEKN